MRPRAHRGSAAQLALLARPADRCVRRSRKARERLTGVADYGRVRDAARIFSSAAVMPFTHNVYGQGSVDGRGSSGRTYGIRWGRIMRIRGMTFRTHCPLNL